MQRIPIVENIFCHTLKQFNRIVLSHVTVTDPDSSDSSRLYPNERQATDPSVTCQSNSIPTKFLLSASKEISLQKVKNFKYLGSLLTNQNSIHEEMKCTLQAKNAFFHNASFYKIIKFVINCIVYLHELDALQDDRKLVLTSFFRCFFIPTF